MHEPNQHEITMDDNRQQKEAGDALRLLQEVVY